MIFGQLFEPLFSTYCDLLSCEETGEAVLIDPVIVAVARDVAELGRLGLSLAFTLETHIDADPIMLDLRTNVIASTNSGVLTIVGQHLFLL